MVKKTRSKPLIRVGWLLGTLTPLVCVALLGFWSVNAYDSLREAHRASVERMSLIGSKALNSEALQLRSVTAGIKALYMSSSRVDAEELQVFVREQAVDLGSAVDRAGYISASRQEGGLELFRGEAKARRSRAYFQPALVAMIDRHAASPAAARSFTAFSDALTIDSGRSIIHFQPVFDTRSGVVAGYVFAAAPVAELVEVLSGQGADVLAISLKNLSSASTRRIDIARRKDVESAAAGPLASIASAELGEYKLIAEFGAPQFDVLTTLATEQGRRIAVDFGLGVALVAIALLLVRLLRRARRATRAAKIAAEQRSQFLATMSHEIRTPLNGILGMADLIGKDPLTGKQSEKLQILIRSADNLMRIINEILDVSKINADKMEIDPIECDLSTVLMDATVAVNVRAAEKGLPVHLVVAPEAPRNVVVDAGRVRQILLNLTSNAIKFTERGSVTVRVRRDASREAAPGAVWTLFEVEDTGIGIPEDKLKSVFDEFCQADSTTTRNFGGTGLGLAIVSKIAKLMGGEVGVRSEVGVGSVFWVSLPLQLSAKDGGARERRQKARLNAIKAIVMSGNPRQQEAISVALSRAGCFALEAEDFPDLLERIEQEHLPDDPLDYVAVREDFCQRDELNKLIDSLAGYPEKPRLIALRSSYRSTRPPAEGDGAFGRHYIDEPILGEELGKKISHFTSYVAPNQDGRARVQKKEEKPNFAGTRVLLVEDDQVNQLYALELFSHLGLEPELAKNGKIAVEKAHQEQFDIIFMDCQMPVMDGFAATRSIREAMDTGSIPRAPIVALTANAMKGDKERCLTAGMDDFLTKPMREQTIVDALKRHGCRSVASLAAESEIVDAIASEPALAQEPEAAAVAASLDEGATGSSEEGAGSKNGAAPVQTDRELAPEQPAPQPEAETLAPQPVQAPTAPQARPAAESAPNARQQGAVPKVPPAPPIPAKAPVAPAKRQAQGTSAPRQAKAVKVSALSAPQKPAAAKNRTVAQQRSTSPSAQNPSLGQAAKQASQAPQPASPAADGQAKQQRPAQPQPAAQKPPAQPAPVQPAPPRQSVPEQAPQPAPAPEAQSAPSGGAIDQAVLADTQERMGARFKMLIDIFLTDGREYLESLDDALMTDNFSETGRIAHTLKSSSKMVGALKMSEVAKKLEFAANSGSAQRDDLAALAKQLRSAFESAASALEKVTQKAAG